MNVNGRRDSGYKKLAPILWPGQMVSAPSSCGLCGKAFLCVWVIVLFLFIKEASATMWTLRQHLHFNNASFHGGDKTVWLHRWVHLPRLSSGSNIFVRTNVPEIMFSKVTKPIQMEQALRRGQQTRDWKSSVGLTKFYCQLTSRSQVLAIYLKLRKFKLDFKISAWDLWVLFV